jgi:hypothetical protein
MPAEDGYRCAPSILRATAIKVRHAGCRQLRFTLEIDRKQPSDV